MRLDNETLRQLTIGAVYEEENDEGLSFYKCTPKQIDAWFSHSEFLGNGAGCSTGIRLDFHTNSKNITFATPKEGKYELWIEGVLRHQVIFGGDSEIKAGDPVSFSLCDALGAEKEDIHVTLHLPSHSRGAISYIELDDGAYARRHEFDMKLLIIGDSITQGWNSVYDSYSYAYHVSRFFNAESVIQGIGGSYFHEDTFDQLPFEPDAVTIAYGTNDFGHYATTEEMRAHTGAYLDLIQKEYAGKKIFVISPIWRTPKEKPMGSFADCRGVVIEEAKKRGLIHIDGLSLMPPFEDLYTDGLHPNLTGFGIYGVNLCRELSKHL